MKSRKLLYLVANDRYFCSHRLSLALAARAEGYEVTVATPALGEHQRIVEAGLNFFPLPFQRGSLNPFSEFYTLYKIWKLYRHIRPDIVHHVAIKPVLYGTIIALLTRVPRIINAVAGLGHVFTADSWLKSPLKTIMRFLFNRSSVQVIVQNYEDYDELKALTRRDNIRLILGAGVNLQEFSPTEEPKTPPLRVVHVSRLLWTKGVGELVKAAEILKALGEKVHISIVGEPDLENPMAIPVQTLKDWHNQGIIEWLGHRCDIAALYQQSHVAVLASYYREGIPKSLLEAAACGKPIITCDMPGCRIIVEDGKNGYLIPPRNPDALAEAILKLSQDPLRCQKMGQASRRHAESCFGEDIIHEQTIKLYEQV